MSALTDAQAALAAAHEAHDRTRIAAQKAVASAAELRAKVKGGKAPKVTAAHIAAADQEVEFTALAHHGAGVDIPALTEAVRIALADEVCDEVLTELPQLGQDVTLALEAIEAVFAPLVAAVDRYDTFVETATERLYTVAAPHVEPSPATGGAPAPRPGHGTAQSPFGPDAEAAPVSAQVATPSGGRGRVSFPRHGHPTVDGVNLTSCRGPGQLATVLVPAMRALGAQEGLIEGLRLLAAGAPPIPLP